jgi:hypothetical protein
MAHCIHCGAVTLLFGNDTPICAKCFDERTQEREEQIALWCSRTAGARLRLESAQTRLREFLKDNPVDTLSPDGHFTYRKAIKEEMFAHHEFARIQRIYHNLTIYGVIPDEDELSKEAGAGE